MRDYKNFKAYQPDDVTRQSLQAEYGVLFFKSKCGQDWYDVQKTFSSNTLKIAYDEKGVIRSVSNDVSLLTPANLSVAEVENTEENRKADCFGDWIYHAGKVSSRQYTPAEIILHAEDKKSTLLAKAEATIAPLNRAVRLGIANSEEISMLDAWEMYSVLLSRVDTSKAPDIEWPESPVSK